MKRFFLAFCLAALLLASCTSGNESRYTRGIGVYPGRESDYTGPKAVPGGEEYRNLALLRLARHSSSYDYNLTGQLAVDGDKANFPPKYINVCTQDGNVPKRDREKLFDENDYTPIPVKGAENAFLEFQVFNTIVYADEVEIIGTVTGDADASAPYSLSLQIRREEEDWKTVGEISGKGLPGEAHPGHGPAGAVSSQKLHLLFDLPTDHGYTDFRLNLDSSDASAWSFTQMNFTISGKKVNVLPSRSLESAWMTETGGQEQLVVDLGAVSEFDCIKLYWFNKAVKGSILISENGSKWHKFAELPDNPDAFEILSQKGKARYICLYLEQSIDGNPYILTEMEVYGKGGVKYEPKAQPEPVGNKLFLSGGNWKIQRAPYVTEFGNEISCVDYAPADSWPVATVPGTVATSYYNIGAIPDITYNDDQLQISESYFYSDFWYRDLFYVPEDFKDKTIMLNFDGINWKAEVYMNGSFVGNIDGAFHRGSFDVTELCPPGYTNCLAVKIIKNQNPGIVKEQNRVSADINGGVLGYDNPTFHATIGWDWIPTVRGRNIGIWNDVYLSAHSLGVTVDDAYVRTELPLPSTATATVYPNVTLTNHSSEEKVGTVRLSAQGQNLDVPVSIPAGQTLDLDIDPVQIQDPQLWWPAGYGPQNLYDVQVSFVQGDMVSDTKNIKVGLRQLTYDTSDGTLNVYVNGRRLNCNGGNWGFPEINLNYRGREYDIAVAYHADMGYTIIRDWVGMTGDEEFYEACDRHGVMVWQDFWLANPADGPDPNDNEMFLENARDYIRRIRSHACIAFYCGRNEGNPPAEINEGLEKLVSELHPGMYYIPHSAAGLVSGNGPYRALPVEEYFTLPRGIDKFHSERGMPNVMTAESMKRMLAPSEYWPQTSVWGVHDYALESAQGSASFNAIIEKAFGEASSLEEFTQWAQWVNYNGYRAMYESRSPFRKGLLIWMSHSCWPSMVWQTYDYYFEPTAAYFGVKKACAPIRIQWNPVKNCVEVVNLNAQDQRGLTAYAAIYNYDGKLISEDTMTLDSPEDSTTPLMEFSFNDPALSEVYFIKLRLTKGEELLADNFYWESKQDGNYQQLKQLPMVKVESSVSTELDSDKYRMTVKLGNDSDTPALMIRLKVQGRKSRDSILPVFYQDNYFSLLPGESKEVSLSFAQEDTRGEKPQIVIEGFNVERIVR